MSPPRFSQAVLPEKHLYFASHFRNSSYPALRRGATLLTPNSPALSRYALGCYRGRRLSLFRPESRLTLRNQPDDGRMPAHRADQSRTIFPTVLRKEADGCRAATPTRRQMTMLS